MNDEGAVQLDELPPPAAAPADAGEKRSAEVVPLRRAVERAAETSISLRTGQQWWTDRQLAVVRNNYPEDEQPSDADLLVYLHLCLSTGLDPFRREIYYIGRKDDKAPGGRRFTAQTGIDGYRHIAERTGEYDGRLMTQWCGPDGEWRDVWLSDQPPAAARVAVARRGITHPFYGTATYAEFCPLTEVWAGSKGNRRPVVNEDGTTKTKPMGLWGKMPSHMLAKCAEAQALRSAFPRQLAGIYVEEEMHQADAAHRAARSDAERQRQRDDLAERPWMRAGAPEGEPVTVIDATPPREQMLEELASQARIMGRTMRQWTTRWAAARRKNPEDATDGELWDLVRSRRDTVAAKAAETGAEPFLARTAEDTPGQPAQGGSDGQGGACDPPAAGDGAPAVIEGEVVVEGEAVAGGVPDDPGNAGLLHRFRPDDDDPEQCGYLGCQMGEGDPIHGGQVEGQESLL